MTKQVIKSYRFYHFAIGRGVNLRHKNNRNNFSGVSFKNTPKNCKSNLVIIVALVLKSKAL